VTLPDHFKTDPGNTPHAGTEHTFHMENRAVA
jgi:hypothetical protein